MIADTASGVFGSSGERQPMPHTPLPQWMVYILPASTAMVQHSALVEAGAEVLFSVL